jgi:hypothetical protein
MKRLREFPLDYLTTLLLFVLMPFLFAVRKIPLNYDWTGFFIPYWISISIYSVFAAVILHVIQIGIRRASQIALQPIIERKRTMLILLVLVIESLWLLGFWKTLVTFVDLWAVVLFSINLRNQPKSFIRASLRILVPAFYFSAGFVLISSYNVLIGSYRYFASYDQLFNSIDKILMFGWSVPQVSRILAEKASPSIFVLLEKSYFFMFPQIGAAIILLSVQSEGRRAMRFVGTIALAYQLATLIYFCFPSLGPFYLSNPVSAGLPPVLVTTQIQAELVQKLQSLWHTGNKGSIGLDFYIAFPCMHIAQPLIVLWFLRSMKKIVWVLGVYDFLMLFSIVLLQWHYVVDLAGGAVVSFVAIMVHQYQCKATPGFTVTPEPAAQQTSTGELSID